MATIHIELGFFEGEHNDLEDSEIVNLVCRTNDFLERKIEEYANDNDIRVHSTQIDWFLGERFSLAFAVRANDGNGLPMATNEVYDALKLSDSDMQEYLVRYVIESSQDDPFSQANEVLIKVNMGVKLPQGRLVTAECQTSQPKESVSGVQTNDNSSRGGESQLREWIEEFYNGTSALLTSLSLASLSLPGVPDSQIEESTSNAAIVSAPSASDTSRAALESMTSPALEQVDKFNLIMGFFNTPAYQPTLVEVESLMCEVKKYFSSYLQKRLGDASLTVSLTNIGYSYNANDDCDAPMNVFFTIDATYADGSSVASNEIFHDLRLGEDEILDIIQNYVWASQPGSNVFRSVNQLTFESTLSGDPSSNHLPDGNIAEAICSIEFAPVPAQPNRNGKCILFIFHA